jgi:hypothetical protein
MNAQVKFKFGYGPLVFDRIIPFEQQQQQQQQIEIHYLCKGCTHLIQL